FLALWIRLDEHSIYIHQLFFKEHSIRNQELEYPKGRTLFVLNIPPYVSKEALRYTFGEHFGYVDLLYFVKTNGFKTAYIVFQEELSVEKALKISDNYVVTLHSQNSVCFFGLEKWVIEYNESRIDQEKLKQNIEEYMENYEKQVADKKAKEKAIEEAKENDGWVTVTGRKKRGQFALSRKESTINKVQHKEEQKNKKKQLLNFYTFQIRESKKKNLAELRKKFELDKKRLQDLKSKRTFKPF
ncbi:Ribosomal RNA-processing protein 7 like protein A, partial [Habropoda laboriosa]